MSLLTLTTSTLNNVHNKSRDFTLSLGFIILPVYLAESDKILTIYA
ncbi:hypothetical protein HMPREF9397_1765 [Streptococcus sanguinis SK1087]|uniref:Uncharacterized protein n=1 Tax=Streptococcus sanguinis SK1087 TaxID=888824 RepID=F3SKX2_STRSA|nr:hypothetical protein HMPREF9397_1765 [Streptococcus sanguinis SK1087]